MAAAGETYKHGGLSVDKAGSETFTTATHEPPVIVPVWKIVRGEVYIVPGRTQTQAYEEAARLAGLTLAEFFSVPVIAEKDTTISLTEVVSKQEDIADDITPEFEIPYYGD